MLNLINMLLLAEDASSRVVLRLSVELVLDVDVVFVICHPKVTLAKYRTNPLDKQLQSLHPFRIRVLEVVVRCSY